MSFFRQFPKTDYAFESNGTITRIVDIFRSVKVDTVFLDDMSTYQYYHIKAGERPDIVSSILYGTPDYYWTFFVINEHLKTGLSGWPMSPEEFEDFITLEYSNIVVDSEPYVDLTTDSSLRSVVNSVAGGFVIGSTVTGQTSGAVATVKEKNVQMNQLVLSSASGNFLEGETIIGSGTRLVGKVSVQDSISISTVYSHKDAPHHYENLATNREYYSNRFVNENAIGIVDAASTLTNTREVSYYEYELQLNDERADIRVIRPNMIYAFAQLYGKLINE